MRGLQECRQTCVWRGTQDGFSWWLFQDQAAIAWKAFITTQQQHRSVYNCHTELLTRLSFFLVAHLVSPHAHLLLLPSFVHTICLLSHTHTHPPQTDSRLYAGLHFRSSNEDGAKLGKLVASKVFDRINKPAAAASKAAAVASEKGAAAAAGRRLFAAVWRS